jgi:alcohol-forming fatty acyl-CoA reductase
MTAAEHPANLDLGTSHVLLTGATGFVGQAVLERLLSTHPGTRVTVLIRARGATGAESRLKNLLKKPVFSVWREAVGDEEAQRQIAERVHVLEGDLTAVPALPTDLDVVIHGASTVSFDPPIDEAFDTNLGGAVNLYEALAATGTDPYVVHVSTAYVGGTRKGVNPEGSLTHSVDWRVEWNAARTARERVEMESRRPEELRRRITEARRTQGKAGPQAVAAAAEEARVAEVTARLVDFGRTRGESLGWPDVYTFTKAMSERAAEQLWGAEHRLSIVRPAIIESAVAHPFPGWIDGFKVADPLIIAYGRGQLPEFPGLPDSVLDLIPVDFVVNTILAVAANPPERSAPKWYHAASGNTNPLPFFRMYENVREYFQANPMPHEERGHVKVPSWTFPGGRSVARGLKRRERAIATAEQTLRSLPAGRRVRGWAADLSQLRHDLESLQKFTGLYEAYTQTEIIFDDTNARALDASLPEELRVERGFDVSRIDWDDFLQRVHIPAITALTKAYAARRAATPAGERKVKPLPERSDVLAVFDLEGTVVDTNIVEQYLWVRAQGIGAAKWPFEFLSLLASLPKYLVAERRDRGEFIRTFSRRYRGLQAARVRRAVSGAAGSLLTRKALPAALARVQAHRDAGHRTVLVTGSIDVLVEPLRPYFDDIVAGRMHERDGVLTGYLDAPPLVDEARAAWLRKYAADHGANLTQSYGYGDSHSDLAWLQLVGHAHAVNPDGALYREARRKRWTVEDWSPRG